MATVSAADWAPALRDQAFERLYRRYVRDVYQYSLALLRNPADAEDVTQTTFMNAYRAMQRGERPLKPHNWLIKIAHNAARTRYARQKVRAPEVPLDDHAEALAAPDHERPDLRGVLDALGELPFNQRAALVMRELEGRSYAEIAETLDVSTAAVETLIFRARRGMRLRVSAVRSLAAVPLPGSLVSLLEGGAAGGAAVGAGLAAKAAVAIVAGLVAGGAGYRAVDATLAAHRQAKPAPSDARATRVAWQALERSGQGAAAAERPAERRAAASRPETKRPRATPARHAGARIAGSDRIETRTARDTGAEAAATRVAGSGGATSAAEGASASSGRTSGASAPAGSGSDPVSKVVGTVTSAAPTPVAVPTPPPVHVPSLPVAAPTLPPPPPPPVNLPPPPVNLPPPPPLPPPPVAPPLPPPPVIP